MNIFVTVGTTRFDSLIKEVESIAREFSDISFTVQVGKSGYRPNDCESFTFSSNVNKYIDNADLIITHAGAGSVYSLLEKGKSLIVVPNLERVDDHQLDIANFVYKNKYAQVAFELSIIRSLICRSEQFDKFEKIVYEKDSFFLAEYIFSFIEN